MDADRNLRSTGQPFQIDWRRADDYRPLAKADRSAFAWEWLRRSSGYRQAWSNRPNDDAALRSECRAFGLERFEDPDRAIPDARPLWSATHDPGVIRAGVCEAVCRADRIDLLKLVDFVSLTVDEDDIEHLLLSDGLHFLRIDIVEGTLIGYPSALRYKVIGIASLREPLSNLTRLIALVERGRIPNDVDARYGRRDRWILELRVADALASGASQQEIARELFGQMIEPRRWRSHNAAHRLRVQRLVRGARANIERPLQPRWFTTRDRDIVG